MQAIHSAPVVAPVVEAKQATLAIHSLAIPSAALCAGAFVLLVATAVSDYLVRVMTAETADWPRFLGQFAMPAIPVALVMVLLAARSHTAAALVGLGGTLLYLILWVTVAF